MIEKKSNNNNCIKCIGCNKKIKLLSTQLKNKCSKCPKTLCDKCKNNNIKCCDTDIDRRNQLANKLNKEASKDNRIPNKI